MVGNKVKLLLNDRNMSILWLSKEMDISYSTLHQKLNNDTFTANDLLKICKIFDVNLEYFEKVDKEDEIKNKEIDNKTKSLKIKRIEFRKVEDKVEKKAEKEIKEIEIEDKEEIELLDKREVSCMKVEDDIMLSIRNDLFLDFVGAIEMGVDILEGREYQLNSLKNRFDKLNRSPIAIEGLSKELRDICSFIDIFKKIDLVVNNINKV